MKKLFFSLLVSLLSVYTVSAQNQLGVFSLSGNLSYGTDIESLGVGLRAQYGLTDYIRGAGEYKYYIDRRNVSAWGVSTELHYVFPASKTVSLYPIAGISFSRWTLDTGRSKPGNLYDIKDSHNRVGANLGFGGQIAVADNIYVQIEAKEALIKDHTQFVALVGFMYQF